MQRFLASLVLIAGAGAGAGRVAAAQARDTLVGVDVRFRPITDTSFFGSRDNRWTLGRINRTMPDTIVAKIRDGCAPSCLRSRDSLLTLTPLADWQIQRRRGIGSRGGNELAGGLLGAAAGVIYVLADIHHCQSTHPSDDMCGLEIIVTPLTAGGGAIFGALVGRFVAPFWEPLLLFHPPPGD